MRISIESSLTTEEYDQWGISRGRLLMKTYLLPSQPGGAAIAFPARLSKARRRARDAYMMSKLKKLGSVVYLWKRIQDRWR
jgi:hypothetical protein